MNEQIEYCADILKALGQPTRLKIIESLRDGDHCACEIVAAIGEEQSSTCCHLNQMLASGLLSHSIDNLTLYYAIKHPQVLAIADLVTELMHREIGNPQSV